MDGEKQNLTKETLAQREERIGSKWKEEKIFEKQFKKINNIYPNAAAKKGFDVTFDAMLRICQPEGFVKSAATTKTEYIENAFDYNSSNGLISNNATYLLYYDSDLTIKQAQ